ncbi:MAG: AAA family ATPase [Pseudonocardia sp.]|nr:AAA family ATPase [Pseudonocardia sp.]
MTPTARPLIGRAAELAGFGVHLEGLPNGNGRLVLISGEPGIGKTRLAAAVAELARQRGFGVLVGRCQETEGAPPYWPWTQVMRGLGAAHADPDGLGPLLTGRAGEAVGTDRFRLFATASELLIREAAGQPLLVVLDDLHRADEASLDLLRFLVPALHGTRLLLVAAYRDNEVPAQHPLTRMLGEVAGDDAFELVQLDGLTAGDAAELAARIGDDLDGLDVAEIHERTGGNPFFLTEILRLGPGRDGPMPATVGAAIRARLRMLPDDTRELLGLAAVLGRDVDMRLLAALADRPALELVGELASAVDTGLLTRRPDTMNHRFVHILVQRALYDGWPAARLAEVHDRVVMTIGHGEPTDAARLAHHAACAVGVPGGAARAFELALRAASTAAAGLADADAADWYARALELAEPGDERIVDLLLELGRCAGRAGRTDGARAAFERAWTLGTERGLAQASVAAALGLGDVVVSAGRIDAGLVRMLERTLALLGPDVGADRIRVHARLATELYWGPELPRARALAAGTVTAARTGGDRQALASALAAAQFVLRGPDGLEHRIELGTELVDIAVRAGDEESELGARRMLIPDLLQTDPVRADAELTALADLATTSRRPLAQWYVQVFRAMRATMAGRPDAAELVDRAHTLGRRIRAQPASIYAAGQRFALRHQLDRGHHPGQPGGLEDELRRLASRYPVLTVFRCLLAVLLAETGRDDEAGALLDELTAHDCAALPPDSLWLANTAMLAETAAMLDHAAHAADLHTRLAPYTGRIAVVGVPMWHGAIDRYLALTATTLGRWDEAEADFRAALRLHEAWGAVPFVKLTLREHAAMLRRRGAPGDRPRATRLAGQADALVPGPAGPSASGLTQRETEVLARLAEGSSNKEIAQRLHLSVHTVERHISNIYLKIGARNRAEATGYALGRGD